MEAALNKRVHSWNKNMNLFVFPSRLVKRDVKKMNVSNSEVLGYTTMRSHDKARFNVGFTRNQVPK